MRYRSALLAFSSAILLVLSFPNFNQPWCAWVALVPWLVSLDGLTPRRAFGRSYLVGALFFLGSLYWLVHVTVLGWIVLCAYLALYFGLFGWLVSRFQLLASSFQLLVIPSAWVALEYVRSHPWSPLAGFGWNLLAYSQHSSLALIQMADLTGAWGVSFLVVMINVVIADWLRQRTDRRQALRSMMIVAACLLAATWYGSFRLAEPVSGPAVTIAVVQGNIPQDQKWDEAFQQRIIAQYERLTARAVETRPDLIIWPETAVPGYLGLDPQITGRVTQVAARTGRPMLVGAPMGRWDAGAWRVTNSAALLTPSGEIAMRYDKLHLVPFGEFVPGERVAPWLRNILPPIGEFVPGHDYTVFTLGDSRLKTQDSRGGLESRVSSLESTFSVLICFEDVFPGLARDFVRRGARMLATITNDAWFGKTAAPYQHAQASTFRAVELRVPMVRAANTGWSGCIDARGRWVASVHDNHGQETFVSGYAVCTVPVGGDRGGTIPTADRAGNILSGEEVSAVAGLPTEGVSRRGGATSLYRRWGDWFALLCLALTLASLSRRPPQIR